MDNCHSGNRTVTLTAVVLMVAGLCLLFTPTEGIGASGPEWYTQATADSLAKMAAGATGIEPSVQEILDSMGTGLNAVTDLLSIEYFPVAAGCGSVELITEHSGLANENVISWYNPGLTSPTFEIFAGPVSPPASVTFSPAGVDSIAFTLFHPPYAYWYSEQALNFDGNPHVKVYPGGQPDSYLMFWEDLPWLSDADFNDLVFKVRLPTSIPTIVCQPPREVSFCDSTYICSYFTVTDPGADSITIDIIVGGTVETRTVASGVEDSVCMFLTETGEVSVAIVATNDCGLIDICASGFLVNPNSPPIIVAEDTTLFLCETETVCVPYVTSDPDGPDGLTVAIVDGPGHVDTLNGKINVPGDPGTTTVVLQVTDPCGASDLDTFQVTVTVNQSPAITMGNGAPSFQCEPGEFCVPYTVSDAEGIDGLTEILIAAPLGAVIDTIANTVCFTPDTSGTYFIIAEVADTCGAMARDTSIVIVTANDPPSIGLGGDTALNQCVAAPICVDYAIADPDGLAGLSESYVAGPGIIDTLANTVCFTPDTSGVYTIITSVSDQCLATDVDTILVTVSVNGPPSVFLPDDFAAFQCAPAAVCVDYTVSDPDGLSGVIASLVSGPAGASLDTAANTVCFTPPTSGQYTVIVRAADSCAIVGEDTVTVDVTINSAPGIVLANGVPVFQCRPGELCIDYVVSDADGSSGLTEALVTGLGIIDTSANTICFTPDTSGIYTIIAEVTDSCGASVRDTVSIIAETNQPPTVMLDDDFAASQCAPTEICVTYATGDPNGIDGLTELLTTGPGVIDTAANTVCFTPDTSGTYTLIVQATDPCGETDFDTALITVSLNRDPSLAMGGDFSEFQCLPTEICVDYAASDPDGPGGLTESLVAGPAGATIDTAANTVCFTPPASGSYCIVVKTADSCGAQVEDTVCVTVALNGPPTIALSADTIVAQCQPGPICLSYTVDDPDGAGALTEEVIVGPFGTTIDTVLNEICFTPDTNGIYTLVVTVTDSCGEQTSGTVLVSVAVNSPPKLTLDADTSIFLCEPLRVAVAYTATDPDGNDGLVESLPAGPGTLDTIGNTVWYIPFASGIDTIIVMATDPCGIVDTDTVIVTVTLNSSPVVSFGEDRSLFLCVPEPICVDYTVSDTNGLSGIMESALSLPPGASIDTAANSICFTPDTSGVYVFVVMANDSCLTGGLDTLHVTVELNGPPAVNFGADFSLFQCEQAEICVPYTVFDPNGPQGVLETLITGPAGAALDTASHTICFIPGGRGDYLLVVGVTDSCGWTDTDSITVAVGANRPPQVTVTGSQPILACAPGSFCVAAATAGDPDGNLDTAYTSTAGGTFDPATGELCFDADTAGAYCFEIIAADSCGAADTAFLCVDVTINRPPDLTLGAIPDPLMFTEPTQLCLPVGTTDPDTDQRYDITMMEGAGVFTPVAGRNASNLSHCFVADTTGCYRFVFAATDSCGATGQDTATVCVQIEPPDSLFQICIDTAMGLNGEVVTVNVQGRQLMAMGGFEFLVCYDAAVLDFAAAQPDSTLAEWEYFTFRIGSAADCFTCPDGVIRLIGIADMNNGASHPPAGALVPKGNMISLSFVITPDRSFIGQCVTVGFCFEQCSDNAVSSPSGDTTYLSFTAAADSCFDGSKFFALPRIEFCDGAICIIPPKDDRGDINLNGIAFEVGDAVLFTNFFIFGHGVWEPANAQAQILATDTNCDGIVLTLADLIKLLRVITGDDNPTNCPDVAPKIAPLIGAADVHLERMGGRLTVSVDADVDLGGLFVSLRSPSGEFRDITWGANLDGFTLKANANTGSLRAIIVPDEQGARLASGHHLLFSAELPENAELVVEDAQAASFDGIVVPVDLFEPANARPQTFELEQNYPNPFNAGTVIRFQLASPAVWELTIYNVLGQPVRRFDGFGDAGPVSVRWEGELDAGGTAGTGVYFARLQAGQFAATRKMLLLR